MLANKRKRPYYPLLSFLTLTRLTTYQEVGALIFGVSNNILNVIARTTSTIVA
jgi:hypothetical protein